MLKIFASLFLIIICASESYADKYTTVIIDPGHGGKDRGAKWGGVSEAYLNLQLAKKIMVMLKAKKIPVRLTRQSDIYLNLSQRAAVANRYKNAMFVSIHFNAHTNTSIRGIETFYASKNGKKIAASIQRNMSRRLKTRNRGIKKGLQFAVLNKTKCPAVLVECGFISNPYERRRCSKSWYQSVIARGIVEGIIKTR